MIEQFETEQTDYFSLLGRTALVTGGTYAGYKTFKDLKSNTSINPLEKSSQNKANRLRNIRGNLSRGAPEEGRQAGKTIADILGLSPDIEKQKSLKSLPLSDFKLISNMGYRNPGELSSQLEDFTSLLKNKGFSGVNVSYKKTSAGEIGEIFVRGKFNGASMTFPINPVSSSGTVLFGNNLQNRFAARSVVDPSSIGSDALKFIDSDIALINKYKTEIDSISQGIVRPKDLSRKIQDALIYQGDAIRGGEFAGMTGELRKGEAILDPFSDMSSRARKEIMRNIVSQPQYMAGSASSFAKGIITTPESILHSAIPSGGVSPAAYQYIRETSFDSALRPKTDFFKGLNLGVGEFSYAYVDKAELQETINQLSKKVAFPKDRDFSAMFAGIGEIADEEILMDASKNFRARNPLYSTTIDANMLSTPASEGLFAKITNRLGLKDFQELGEVLQSPEGLASLGEEKMKLLNFDLNEDYKMLKSSEQRLFDEFRQIRANKSIPKEMRKLQTEEILSQLKETRSVRLEYEAFGISQDMAYSKKLPAKDLTNRIINMRAQGGQIHVAMETEFSIGAGSKVFGGIKSTVKGETNLSVLLAQNEFRAQTGRIAEISELAESGLLEKFKDIDFVGVESPVKMSGRTMEARRMPAAVMGYVSTAQAEGRIKDIEALGDYLDPSFQNQKRVIEQIQKNHPNMDLADVLAGSKFEGQVSSARVSKTILSSDFHSVQSGMGRAGTFTERGMMFMEAQGLDAVSENIMSRFMRDQDPIARLDTFLEAQEMKPQTMARSLYTEGSLKGVLNPNLDIRKGAIESITSGGNTLSVDLGQDISFEMGGKTRTIRQANIFSQSHMSPYVGVQIGTTDSLTAYDKSVKDLIEAAANPATDPRVLQAKALRYAQEQEVVRDSLANALMKGKVKGSMYGQAVSALPGMDDAAVELGRQMGLGQNIPAPMVAMSKADIRARFGEEALKQASVGDLFGLLTKEPIEGSHSVMPTQIRVAEDFTGGKLPQTLGDMRGRVFLSGSDMMRQGAMLDFDKDPVSVIAMTEQKAKSQLMDFMGLTGRQSETGREYYQSLMRMRDLSPKTGKTPIDALSQIDSQLAALITSQKQLEKGNIGIFSNEFRNIHVGLREQLAQGGAASQFYKGEDFAHVFVENIIKSKHQSQQAIMRNEAMETLDVLRGSNKYASASRQERALRLQEIFDQLSFGQASEGKAAREMAQTILKDNMTAKLYQAGAIDKAAEAASMMQGIDAGQARRALSYAEVSSQANLENVLKAHEAGARIAPNKTDELISIFQKSPQKTSAMQANFQRAGETGKALINTGIGNIFKYAIAPAAVIGLASSIMSSPNVLRESSGNHAASDPGSKVDMGKTLFAIPESKVDNIKISGRANANTDFNYLRQRANATGNSYGGSMRDMRSTPDKHRLQELIDRGY